MRENGLSATIWPRRNAKEVFFLMKKINQTLAALLLVLAACAPGLASPLGVRVAIPEGWKCVQDEQVLIYNRIETAAVIIDQVGTNNGECAESVASSLADAVGVKKKDIRRDKSGELSMEFTQNGEPVTVRVVDDNSRVLMIYAIGGDAEARRIAGSVGKTVPPAAPRAEAAAAEPAETAPAKNGAKK